MADADKHHAQRRQHVLSTLTAAVSPTRVYARANRLLGSSDHGHLLRFSDAPVRSTPTVRESERGLRLFEVHMLDRHRGFLLHHLTFSYGVQPTDRKQVLCHAGAEGIMLVLKR